MLNKEQIKQTMLDSLIKYKGFYTLLDVTLIDEAIASTFLDDERGSHTCYEGHCKNQIQEPRH